ncbi:transcription initiation factor TFIID subunit 4b-like isoform X2 [Salvia miltiorrhiza]|uniref:transcription initiation factor TFIID subunit 4b-like isoform X2 n=1 Tax=Salvia miltiorrhiza TaxID=226208 RepID=UPI0025ABBADE|nr:transcription initiation factor TFIID subunit 4b-like isoform X2 [Salvia miltiorrhiza]
MDPNIMKFLEEDEDETMHSGADVEAFTAELNRDIEGNNSIQEDSFDSNAALSQGSSHMTGQFLPQWHTSHNDGIANFQSGQDITTVGEKDQHSSELELHRHDSDSQNRKEDDSSSHEPNPNQQDDQNTFPLPQTVSGQPSGEHPITAQVLDHEAKPDKELQMNKLQNISQHPSMAVGSNDQQPLSMEFSDQQILPAGKGNSQTSMGVNNDQVMPPLNQQTTGMPITSQQAITSGMSNPQTMTSSSQQSVTALKLNKQVPFGMLLPIIQPQLDKDRAMQLHTLYFKLKRNEISKDGFVRHMRSIVGDQMLKMAVYKLQTQAVRNSQASQAAPNQFQSQPQASGRQMPSAQLPTDLSNSISDNNAAKSREVERQADSHGAQVGQMSTTVSGALSHERKHPAFPAQGLNKQQHMQFSQTSFPTYGGAGSGYPPFPPTSAASSAPIRPQSHDSQMRQAPSHPNITANHLGPTSRPMNVTNTSTFDSPHSLTDPKKIPAGSLTHMNSNPMLQQSQVQWPSSTSKEQKTSISSSAGHVKQEPSDQLNEQHKSQLSASHGLSSLTPGPSKLGSAASGNMNLKDESFEMQSSRTGLTAPATLVPSNSVSSPSPSMTETNIMSNSRMPSLTTPVGPGNNSKAPPKKPLVGQKKPMEAPGSSPPSSKKQKVSGSFVDQSIEHLNDVTAVSGVNLREEEEQLFSGSKEDSRVSEASRRVVQEEEEKLILQKIPLQKMMAVIMAKCGLKNMSNDVERCLSLCVEERMRGLISNIIRLSKQRVDVEKPRHKTIITSDVRQQIMAINSKAREDWEKKQAETEKSQKLSESESSTGADADKEKDENRGKSVKVNKEEDDKMRATAANVAVRAATGVGDITSRWQLMIEAKQKQGGTDISSGPQTNKDVGRKPLATSTRNTRENQESEKRDSSVALTTPASIRKVGRNQVVVPRVARSISVKDVIALLEREPQMSKSTLLYRLYHKVSTDAVSE